MTKVLGPLLESRSLKLFLSKAAKKHTGADWAEKYGQDAHKELGANPKDFVARVKRAAEAHHHYEKKLGKPDKDWAGWYARHMSGHRLHEDTLNELSPALIGRYTKKASKDLMDTGIQAGNHFAQSNRPDFPRSAATHMKYGNQAYNKADRRREGLNLANRRMQFKLATEDADKEFLKKKFRHKEEKEKEKTAKPKGAVKPLGALLGFSPNGGGLSNAFESTQYRKNPATGRWGHVHDKSDPYLVFKDKELLGSRYKAKEANKLLRAKGGTHYILKSAHDRGENA